MSESIKIETFDFIPPRANSTGHSFPFDQMTDGEYFVVPIEKDEDEKTVAKRLSTTASVAGSDLGMKFSVRTIDYNDGLALGVYCQGER